MNLSLSLCAGETVTLVKGPSVYSGSYELILNITDSGGLSSRQKLSVTVRNCADNGRSYTTQAGAHGISVIFICFFLMLCKQSFSRCFLFFSPLNSKTSGLVVNITCVCM